MIVITSHMIAIAILFLWAIIIMFVVASFIYGYIQYYDAILIYTPQFIFMIILVILLGGLIFSLPCTGY